LGEAQKHTPWTTELEGIRAPLGVILYLIRRDNLDIYDIPIAKITREYLDYLNLMDLAGEFFVLAATLMRIKVQMLLRKDDDTDEDPRQELVRSILEYKKMVEAAKNFRDLEDERARVFTRPVPQEEKDAVTGEVVLDLNLFQLMRAFQEVMTQFEGAEVREVELEAWTIEEKIDLVRSTLETVTPGGHHYLHGHPRIVEARTSARGTGRLLRRHLDLPGGKLRSPHGRSDRLEHRDRGAGGSNGPRGHERRHGI